ALAYRSVVKSALARASNASLLSGAFEQPPVAWRISKDTIARDVRGRVAAHRCLVCQSAKFIISAYRVRLMSSTAMASRKANGAAVNRGTPARHRAKIV